MHNRAYWAGADYLGIGPSAFSTIGLQRWQNVCDYRVYADRVLAGESSIFSRENLTREMKRAERIALGLRTSTGVTASDLNHSEGQVNEFITLGLLRQAGDRFVLTRKGKALADSVAEAFV
jgi:oxygen-independent coproporphyrinogen-3 oxidase